MEVGSCPSRSGLAALLFNFLKIFDNNFQAFRRRIESGESLFGRKVMSDKEKVDKIKEIVSLAEEWAEQQTMAEGQICMAALKDVRRVVRAGDKKS